MAKLYPPQLQGSLPAFCNTYTNYGNITIVSTTIKIPFGFNSAVSINSIKNIAIKIRTTSTSTYLVSDLKASSVDFENGVAIFKFNYNDNISIFQESQYYRIQVAFIDAADEIGYYSTVGIIKCIAKPKISIKNCDPNDINMFDNTFCGLYEQDTSFGDSTEKAYSYIFNIYNDSGEIIASSGLQAHDITSDTSSDSSEDIWMIHDSFKESEIYYLQYTVTTLNNLTVSSIKYKIMKTVSVPLEFDIQIHADMDYDNGYVDITLQGEIEKGEQIETYYFQLLDSDALYDENETYYILDGENEWVEFIGDLSDWHTLQEQDSEEKLYTLVKSQDREKAYSGNFIITRSSSDSNFTEWIEIARFTLQSQQPSKIHHKDCTIQQGVEYKYALQQYNIHGIYSQRKYQTNAEGRYNTTIADFEDIYLSDGERQLKIRFNPKVKKFKNTIPEKKIETMGSKYPFIFRNGSVSYKEFSIDGLISYHMDTTKMFLNSEELLEAGILEQDSIRGVSSIDTDYNLKGHESSYKIVQKEKPVYDPISNQILYTKKYYTIEKKTSQDSKITMNKPIIGYNIDESRLQNTSNIRANKNLTSENIKGERYFKLKVLEWLTNGKVKLFRSSTEGNYLVRLVNVSLKPIDKLGRMLHSFTCTAYEIGEVNYDNLVHYGIITPKTSSNFEENWGTINIREIMHNENAIKDDNNFIKVTPENININSVYINHFAPGDQLKVLYNEDNEEGYIFTIGVTGSLELNNDDRKIIEIWIKVNDEIKTYNDFERELIYSYDSIVMTKFDTISKVAILTRTAEQFIGPKENLLAPVDLSKKAYGIPNLEGVVEEPFSEDEGLRNVYNELKKRDTLNYNIKTSYNTATENNTEIEKYKVLKVDILHVQKRKIIPIFAYSKILNENTTFGITPFSKGYVNNKNILTFISEDQRTVKYAKGIDNGFFDDIFINNFTDIKLNKMNIGDLIEYKKLILDLENLSNITKNNPQIDEIIKVIKTVETTKDFKDQINKLKEVCAPQVLWFDENYNLLKSYNIDIINPTDLYTLLSSSIFPNDDSIIFKVFIYDEEQQDWIPSNIHNYKFYDNYTKSWWQDSSKISFPIIINNAKLDDEDFILMPSDYKFIKTHEINLHNFIDGDTIKIIYKNQKNENITKYFNFSNNINSNLIKIIEDIDIIDETQCFLNANENFITIKTNTNNYIKSILIKPKQNFIFEQIEYQENYDENKTYYMKNNYGNYYKFTGTMLEWQEALNNKQLYLLTNILYENSNRILDFYNYIGFEEYQEYYPYFSINEFEHFDEYVLNEDGTYTWNKDLPIVGSNMISLNEINDITLYNLGNIDRIYLGNGVMAEISAQMHIVDYDIEETSPAVYEAKTNYLNAYNNYETILGSVKVNIGDTTQLESEQRLLQQRLDLLLESQRTQNNKNSYEIVKEVAKERIIKHKQDIWNNRFNGLIEIINYLKKYQIYIDLDNNTPSTIINQISYFNTNIGEEELTQQLENYYNELKSRNDRIDNNQAENEDYFPNGGRNIKFQKLPNTTKIIDGQFYDFINETAYLPVNYYQQLLNTLTITSNEYNEQLQELSSQMIDILGTNKEYTILDSGEIITDISEFNESNLPTENTIAFYDYSLNELLQQYDEELNSLNKSKASLVKKLLALQIDKDTTTLQSIYELTGNYVENTAKELKILLEYYKSDKEGKLTNNNNGIQKLCSDAIFNIIFNDITSSTIKNNIKIDLIKILNGTIESLRLTTEEYDNAVENATADCEIAKGPYTDKRTEVSTAFTNLKTAITNLNAKAKEYKFITTDFTIDTRDNITILNRSAINLFIVTQRGKISTITDENKKTEFQNLVSIAATKLNTYINLYDNEFVPVKETYENAVVILNNIKNNKFYTYYDDTTSGIYKRISNLFYNSPTEILYQDESGEWHTFISRKILDEQLCLKSMYDDLNKINSSNKFRKYLATHFIDTTPQIEAYELFGEALENQIKTYSQQIGILESIIANNGVLGRQYDNDGAFADLDTMNNFNSEIENIRQTYIDNSEAQINDWLVNWTNKIKTDFQSEEEQQQYNIQNLIFTTETDYTNKRAFNILEIFTDDLNNNQSSNIKSLLNKYYPANSDEELKSIIQKIKQKDMLYMGKKAKIDKIAENYKNFKDNLIIEFNNLNNTYNVIDEKKSNIDSQINTISAELEKVRRLADIFDSVEFYKEYLINNSESIYNIKILLEYLKWVYKQQLGLISYAGQMSDNIQNSDSYAKLLKQYIDIYEEEAFQFLHRYDSVIEDLQRGYDQEDDELAISPGLDRYTYDLNNYCLDVYIPILYLIDKEYDNKKNKNNEFIRPIIEYDLDEEPYSISYDQFVQKFKNSNEEERLKSYAYIEKYLKTLLFNRTDRIEEQLGISCRFGLVKELQDDNTYKIKLAYFKNATEEETEEDKIYPVIYILNEESQDPNTESEPATLISKITIDEETNKVKQYISIINTAKYILLRNPFESSQEVILKPDEEGNYRPNPYNSTKKYYYEGELGDSFVTPLNISEANFDADIKAALQNGNGRKVVWFADKNPISLEITLHPNLYENRNILNLNISNTDAYQIKPKYDEYFKNYIGLIIHDIKKDSENIEYEYGSYYALIEKENEIFNHLNIFCKLWLNLIDLQLGDSLVKLQNYQNNYANYNNELAKWRTIQNNCQIVYNEYKTINEEELDEKKQQLLILLQTAQEKIDYYIELCRLELLKINEISENQMVQQYIFGKTELDRTLTSLNTIYEDIALQTKIYHKKIIHYLNLLFNQIPYGNPIDIDIAVNKNIININNKDTRNYNFGIAYALEKYKKYSADIKGEINFTYAIKQSNTFHNLLYKNFPLISLITEQNSTYVKGQKYYKRDKKTNTYIEYLYTDNTNWNIDVTNGIIYKSLFYYLDKFINYYSYYPLDDFDIYDVNQEYYIQDKDKYTIYIPNNEEDYNLHKKNLYICGNGGLFQILYDYSQNTEFITDITKTYVYNLLINYKGTLDLYDTLTVSIINNKNSMITDEQLNKDISDTQTALDQITTELEHLTTDSLKLKEKIDEITRYYAEYLRILTVTYITEVERRYGVI